MKILEAVQKREVGAKRVRREGWGESGQEPFFSIVAIDKELSEKIEDASIDPDRPFKTEKVDGFRTRKVANVNPESRMENLTYFCIDSWDGFLWEHMQSIASLDYRVSLAGVDPKSAVEFTDENRRAVAMIASTQFRSWVLSIASDVAAYHAEMDKELEKN